MIPASIPRAALVTGGAARLGRAIALALAEAGFAVAVHYRSAPEAAEATAAELRRFGVGATTLQAELGVEGQTTSLVARATEALGPIGVLVNNASLFERDSWDDATRASWDSHLEPNLRAPFVLSQSFARALPVAAEGVVINMLDVSGVGVGTAYPGEWHRAWADAAEHRRERCGVCPAAGAIAAWTWGDGGRGWAGGDRHLVAAVTDRADAGPGWWAAPAVTRQKSMQRPLCSQSP